MKSAFTWLAAGTALAAFVFTLWPGIDLAVSATFHDTATGAWSGNAPLPKALRDAIWSGSDLLLLLFVPLFALALVRRGQAQVPPRVWGFALAAMALGPGLLVNGLLKAHWGRARPRDILEFGGTQAFTPALDIADQCARNCSFVSGEVSNTATLALILWLIAARRAPGLWRPVLALVLAGLTLLTVWLRISAGGHFLSDTVFAVLFSAIVTLGLWRAMAVAPGAARLTPASLAGDLRALWPKGKRPK